MSEEETNKESTEEEESKESEKTEETPKEGEEAPMASDILERAEQAGKNIKEGLKEIDKKIKKMEAIQAENIIRGTALGNMIPIKEEISAEDYAEKVMNGEINPLNVK